LAVKRKQVSHFSGRGRPKGGVRNLVKPGRVGDIKGSSGLGHRRLKQGGSRETCKWGTGKRFYKGGSVSKKKMPKGALSGQGGNGNGRPLLREGGGDLGINFEAKDDRGRKERR